MPIYNLPSRMRFKKEWFKSRLVISLILLALLGGVGYVSSAALYRDVEESNKGVFVVGTLDLVVGKDSQDVINLESLGDDQKVTGSKTWTVRNGGSLPGQLRFELTDIQNEENGCNEPEEKMDRSCGNPGVGEGELGAALATRLKVKVGNDPEIEIIKSTLASAAQSDYLKVWSNRPAPIILKPNETAQITMEWTESEFGNETQGDSVKFDVKFELQQVRQSNR